MEKDILIIGNADSIWLKEYIKNIHCKFQNMVTVITFNNVSSSMKRAYLDMNVNLLIFNNNQNISNQIVNTLKILYYIAKNRNKFDFLEIHYPPSTIQAYFLAIVEKIMIAKKLIVFWGSDLLRVKKTHLNRLKLLIDKCDLINLPTEELVNKFELFFTMKYRDKYVSVPFGSLSFDEQNNIGKQFSKAECKKKIGVKHDEITVAVGYNGKKEQQHIKVIEVLANLSQDIKKRLVLILHLVNTIDQEYYDEIKKALNNCGIEFIIINDMLPLEEIAILRQATDIFIQAQFTDALSGTVREALYSEAILVNPTWIKYNEFDKIGIEYIQYDDILDINKIIEKILDESIVIDVKKNKEKIYNNFSWDAVIDKWQRIYNG